MSETIKEIKIDRTGWPAGEWDSEPDRVDFIHSGFSCMLLRGPVGSWCGYVGVPENHPTFGKNYNDVDVSVHGGLTYADSCRGQICHIPQPGMPENVWWLGFDTAHFGDLSPAMMRYENESYVRMYTGSPYEPYETYKNLAYTRKETENLAEQLAAMGASA